MAETLVGLLVIFMILAVVLAYFEIVDPLELIGGVLRLMAATMFAIGAFFVWLVKRGGNRKAS